MIFSAGSSSREGTNTGRRRASNARSAIRAERFAERVAPNVAKASTRVPAAVPTSAMVAQSAMSAEDVLALEPPQTDEREEQHVPELQTGAAPQVRVPHTTGDEIDPRVEVVGRQHVADVAEGGDLVEDL